MVRSNIALIGFMCAGKSTVGRVLAARTKKAFVETDALVEERAGMRVADVFARFGEERFRELETQVVALVSEFDETVISCGGGAVLRPENAAALRSSSVVVFLDVSPETVLRRMGPGSRVRPLLDAPDRETRVRDLMVIRQPVYAGTADFTVQTDGIPAEQVVRRIVEEMKRL